MTVAAQSKAEFLALIKRTLSDPVVCGWDGKDGQEIFAAVAAVAAKVSERMAQRFNGRYILRATGGSKATGAARITWTEGSTLGHGLQAGQVIVSTRWGVEYVLSEDLSIGPGQPADTSAVVDITAVYRDWESNVDAVHLDQWALPGGVNRKANILWSDTTTDAAKDEFLAGLDAGTITIEGETDATGGAMGTLDLIAAGRGKPRALNEGDSPLRQRIRSKSRRITPNGILAAVNAVLEPYGVEATLWEPWDGWFTIGDPEWGGIGDPDHPVARLRSFRIEVPNLGYTVDGFVIGDEVQGVIGESASAIGVGDTTSAGIIAGLQDLVDRISLAGVWGHVVETQ